MMSTMKYKMVIIVLIGCFIIGCNSNKETKEYFVGPCAFECNYPFNDTTKWIITCRVWGMLKYYHPNITAGKVDWDKILMDQIEDINICSTAEMFNEELKKMLDAAGECNLKRDEYWSDSLNLNVNLCWLDQSFLDDPLKERLKKIASLQVKQPSYYGLTMDPNNYLTFQHEKNYNFEVISYSKYRLLSLFRYWNVIYYFFPHKYLMDKSWDQTLSASIFPFIHASDKQSFEIALLKLASSLNDGHGFIIPINGEYPIDTQDKIDYIEGNTIIKTDQGELKKTDIIKRIDNTDIKQIRDSLFLLIPASTKYKKECLINCYIAEMIFFHETNVTISRDNKLIKLHALPVKLEKRPLTCYQWVTDNVGYVDLSLLKTDKIDSMFQYFAHAKGILFDLRKLGPYKYDPDQFNCHLSNTKSINFFSMIVPDETHPGAYYWVKNPQLAHKKSGCKSYEGKSVFLINEFTQSSLETKAWESRYNLNAILIGRPTSGALCQVIRFSLPGNYTAVFPGFGAFSNDGKELQRKGIMPDIEVYPSMNSVKNGQDEILDAAVNYITNVADLNLQ